MVNFFKNLLKTRTFFKTKTLYWKVLPKEIPTTCIKFEISSFVTAKFLLEKHFSFKSNKQKFALGTFSNFSNIKNKPSFGSGKLLCFSALSQCGLKVFLCCHFSCVYRLLLFLCCFLFYSARNSFLKKIYAKNVYLKDNLCVHQTELNLHI